MTTPTTLQRVCITYLRVFFNVFPLRLKRTLAMNIYIVNKNKIRVENISRSNIYDHLDEYSKVSNSSRLKLDILRDYYFH